MAGKQAKILSDENIEELISYASATRYPERNVAISLLSAKAGLRAGEIAKLDWDMLLLPTGEIGPCIELRDHASKKGSARRIPIHPRLMQALIGLRSNSLADGSVIQSERGGRMHPVGIVNWFAKAYWALGFAGCSSHSGRRTFVTRAARAVSQAGGSLRDVQLLAGHRSIVTTERYIDGDSDAQRRLVALI